MNERVCERTMRASNLHFGFEMKVFTFGFRFEPSEVEDVLNSYTVVSQLGSE